MCAGSALIGTGCSQNGHSIVSSATVSRTRSREKSDQFLLLVEYAVVVVIFQRSAHLAVLASEQYADVVVALEGHFDLDWTSALLTDGIRRLIESLS